MGTATFIITCCGLAVVLLGAFWRFSNAQGKQTQLIEGLVDQMATFRNELKTDISTVHKRVDKVEDEQKDIRSKQDWMAGKMGVKPGDM